MGIGKWFKNVVDSYNKSRLTAREQNKYFNETNPNFKSKEELTHSMLKNYSGDEMKRMKTILWMEYKLYWDIPNISKEAFISRYIELSRMVPYDYTMDFFSLDAKAKAFYGDLGETFKIHVTNYKPEDVQMLINKLRSAFDTKPRDYDKMLRVISALNKVTHELRKTQKGN